MFALAVELSPVCVFARVFATLGGFILPSAAAALPLLLPLPPLYMHTRAIPYMCKGGQGIESASAGGGVTSTYNSNKNVVVNLLLYRRGFGSMNLCIYVSAYQAVGAGIRGQRWGEWVQKDP